MGTDAFSSTTISWTDPDLPGMAPRGPSRAELQKSRDETHLARLGKKQVLKRRFGMISTLGLSTTLMETWEGVLVYFAFGLANGGSAGLVTSYVLSWVGFLCIMTPLAELCSMAPTSSGQYHWAFMLAPKSSRKLLSYLTGWLSVAVWQSMVAMVGILCATITEDLIVLNHPDIVLYGWHGTVLIWATVLAALFVNSVLGRWLPKIEGVILYIHVLAFFAVIIVLLHLGDRASTTQVFSQWNNDGGWPTMGLAFFVGVVTNVGPFIGADGAVHMAEETQNAAIVVPWNIVITVLFNGLLGFGMLLVTLYCMGDIEAAMQSPMHYPFVQIFYNATQSTAGTTIIVGVIVALCYAAIFGQFAGASRQLWAFARDRGPPMSGWLVLVDPKSYLPLHAIWTTCIISLLLALINIGSEAALLSLLSFTTSSYEAASAIPLGLLLWNRVTHKIRPRHAHADDAAPDDEFALVWGPWRVPEPLGTVVNAAGLCWIAIAFFFGFWPTNAAVTPATMNYSVLMTGFWFLFGVGYYFTIGRKSYHGPIIETR